MFADNLFKFGDRDGSGTNALLQHPLAAVQLPDGRVLVADSYNHKLKASRCLVWSVRCALKPASSCCVCAERCNHGVSKGAQGFAAIQASLFRYVRLRLPGVTRLVWEKHISTLPSNEMSRISLTSSVDPVLFSSATFDCHQQAVTV